MPELPEVARTAMSLGSKLNDSTLTEIKIHSGRYSKHGAPKNFEEFTINFPCKINNITFRGKLIIFELIDKNGKPWWIWNTLGMSGGWKAVHTKHGHVEFVTDKGSVFFTDARNFGTIKITDSKNETEKKIKSIGPNHLHDEISDETFKSRLMKKSKKTLAEVLMDQSLIGGVGNYIKAEALYRANLSPHRTVKDLTDEEFSKLNSSIEEVVNTSFANRGASIKTYSGMDDEKGHFPFFFKVYGRDLCDEGYPVKREQTLDGRTTWWVPQIQN